MLAKGELKASGPSCDEPMQFERVPHFLQIDGRVQAERDANTSGKVSKKWDHFILICAHNFIDTDSGRFTSPKHGHSSPSKTTSSRPHQPHLNMTFLDPTRFLPEGFELAPSPGKGNADRGISIMELVSFFAGEELTSHPHSACPVISGYAAALGQYAPRNLTLPLAIAIAGTRSERHQNLRLERLGARAANSAAALATDYSDTRVQQANIAAKNYWNSPSAAAALVAKKASRAAQELVEAWDPDYDPEMREQAFEYDYLEKYPSASRLEAESYARNKVANEPTVDIYTFVEAEAAQHSAMAAAKAETSLYESAFSAARAVAIAAQAEIDRTRFGSLHDADEHYEAFHEDYWDETRDDILSDTDRIIWSRVIDDFSEAILAGPYCFEVSPTAQRRLQDQEKFLSTAGKWRYR